jgi:hypothetical protein
MEKRKCLAVKMKTKTSVYTNIAFSLPERRGRGNGVGAREICDKPLLQNYQHH